MNSLAAALVETPEAWPLVLRAWREVTGLSQSQAATALAVRYKTYERWEQGSQLPSPIYRRRMADAMTAFAATATAQGTVL